MTGFFNYLNDKNLLLKSKCEAKTVEEFLSFNNLSHTLAARAAAIINITHKLYKSSNKTSKEKINDRFGTHIHLAMRAHVQYVMFIMAIEHLHSHRFADKKLIPIMNLCIKIFALKILQDNTHGLYECGYFDKGASRLIENAMHKLLSDMRPHMIPIVESFAVDTQDYNVIGNKYGDIYELQLETAKRTRLNKQ